MIPLTSKQKASLTEKEMDYFDIMNAKSGVLYIQSKPGVAKSAIGRSIANKTDRQYYDLRLSMIDECDIGLFPKVTEKEDMSYLEHVVPQWAILANQRPTIIHFEELNRAQLSVRNAALQILLERSIGPFFKFNDNVLMMASGNLGEDDNTDVEEFDAALDNRLIHKKHELSVAEWIDGYAKENVHPIIVSFLTNQPEYLYVPQTANTRAYATPRSWTFLSDYIITKHGKDCSIEEFLPSIIKNGVSYIGNTAAKFITYCNETVQLTLDDIIKAKDFNKIKIELKKFKRDKTSELLNSLKERNKDIESGKYTEAQLSNIVSFLLECAEDERAGYITYMIDYADVTNNNIRFVLISNDVIKEQTKKLRELNNNQKQTRK